MIPHHRRTPQAIVPSRSQKTSPASSNPLNASMLASMTTSELLANGITRITQILAELETWLQEHEYLSIEQMQGSMSQQSVAEPAAFERANYMKALNIFDPYLR